MIDKEYLQGLGLTGEQIQLLTDALNKESRYRRILLQEKVSPGIIESIIRTTKIEEIDFGNEDLLREKVRAEWKDMILKPKVSKITL